MKYSTVFSVGLLLWFLETAYFGWNMTAQSGAERVLDIVSGALLFWGAVGYIAQGAVKEYLDSR